MNVPDACITRETDHIAHYNARFKDMGELPGAPFTNLF